MAQEVEGAIGQNQTLTGAGAKPVQVGGVASATVPTAVSAGTAQTMWLAQSGAVEIAGTQVAAADGSTNTLIFLNDTGGSTGKPPVSPFLFNGTTWDRQRGNTGETIQTAGITASASTTLGPFTNFNARGAIFYLNITSLPGSASTTLALKVQGIDPVGGGTIPLAQLAARGTTGTTGLIMYPGITTSAGSALAQVSIILPRTFNVLCSLSTGATSKDVVFSIGIHKEL